MVNNETKCSGQLPACIISEPLLQELWDLLAQDGSLTWEIEVGTGGDLLGIEQERPYQTIASMPELQSLASSLARIDQMLIKVTIKNKGIIILWFKNFARSTGRIMVNGQEAWAQQRLKSVTNLLSQHQQELTTMLYSRIGYAFINSILPFIIAFTGVFVVTTLILRGHIHNGEVVWWIAAINILISFKLASILSNRFLKKLLLRYPYIKWESSN